MNKQKLLTTCLGLGFVLLLTAFSAEGRRLRPATETGGTATVMDRCARLWTALCDRALACGVVAGETAATCLDVGLATCCAGPACLAPEPQPRARLDSCEADVGARSCAALAGPADGTLPLSCAGLL